MEIPGTYEAGFKTEILNLTNREEKIISNNTVWCGSDAGAGCATARANYGLATARGSFQTPRRVRFSAIFRFQRRSLVRDTPSPGRRVMCLTLRPAPSATGSLRWPSRD